MIFLKIKNILAAIFLGLSASAIAVDLPDYYTAGFFTRGINEAAYVDQGGIIDPFWIPVKNWSFIPRVTIEASGDDNYFLENEGTQKTTIINFIPGALLVVGRPEFSHLYVDVGASIPIVQDAIATDDDPGFFGKVGGVYQTGKSKISGQIGYRNLNRENRLVGERMREQNLTGGVSVEHRVSQKTSLGLLGTVEFNEFDKDLYENYQRYYGAGRVYYRVTSKSEMFIQAGAGRDLMDRSANNHFGGARFRDLSIGMRGKPTPKTSVSGRVGYQQRQHDDGQVKDVNTWVAALGADVVPFGLTRFTAHVIADVRPDVTGTSGSISDQRLSLGVNRRLFTERLRGNASVQFGQQSYFGVGNSWPSDYWGYTLGFDWWTLHNLSFGGNYSYIERDSNVSSSAYDSGRWSLRMSWNY